MLSQNIEFLYKLNGFNSFLKTMFAISNITIKQFISPFTSKLNQLNKLQTTMLKLSNITQENSFLKLSQFSQLIHFCCTSQDINNLSYSVIMRKFVTNLNQLVADLAIKYSQVAILSRTHGQVATPTTLGKQFANFAYRISRQINHLKDIKFTGKFNGAVGNYNAHIFAYPQIEWKQLTFNFIKSLNLQPNPYTTQIQSHDTISNFFNHLSLLNTILIGFSRDIWYYISIGYLRLIKKQEQVGSSTMPHKINPIDFQNCEGNLGLSNSLCNYFSAKLPISRLQRDLSDSTVMRNQGVAIGYSILAYNSLKKGLSKINVNLQKINKDLQNHYEVVGEGVQSLMRKYGIQNSYQKIKEKSRGVNFRKQNIQEICQQLEGKMPENEIEVIRNLDPKTYLGNAVEMAKNIKEFIK